MNRRFYIATLLLGASLVSCRNSALFSSKDEKAASEDALALDAECLALGVPDYQGLQLAGMSPAFIHAAREVINQKLPAGLTAEADLATFSKSGTGSQHVVFRFQRDDHPLCREEVKAHLVDGKPEVIGRYPSRKVDYQAPLTWPAQNDGALQGILDKLALGGEATDVTIERCAMVDGGKLHPAWSFQFDHETLPYRGIASNAEVFLAEGQFFHATGTGHAYVKVPVNSDKVQVQAFTLPDLTSGGFLCNPKFVTQPAPGDRRAHSGGFQFTYDPGDPRFRETAVFAHANHHASYLETLPAMSQWLGPQIVLRFEGANGGVNNIATYLPARTGFPPRIKLGLGDGKDLKNLHFDGDVVYHELSHHIVYRSLKSTWGEALVLHEGLADFFVFAQTRNPCIGETICPAGSRVCNNVQCLRSADNKIVYGSDSMPLEEHKRSQIISGILWDMQSADTNLDTLANILYKAVDYLPSSGGYIDFFIAYMKADKEMYKGRHSCRFEQKLGERGFGEILKENEDSLAGLGCTP